VSAEEAVGRISADSLAAYPPGIPNVLPGEILTESCIEFLRATAATPAGRVRGAITPDVSRFRVVDK
jgi:arginine decarboxylase